jgi:hypothetical protein
MKRAVLAVAVVLVVAGVCLVVWKRPWAPREELRYPDVVAAILVRVDTDGDGAVSRVEYARTAAPEEPFERYDVDGDDRISQLELERGFVEVNPGAVKLRRVRKSGPEGRLSGAPP